MKIKCVKDLRLNKDRALDIELSTCNGEVSLLFHLVRKGGSFAVDSPTILPAPLTTHLEMIHRLLTAFAETRQWASPPDHFPAPARAPDWFNSTPLLLYQVRSASDDEYELSFEDADGKLKVVVSKVTPLRRGDFEALGVETQASKEIYHRLPLRPMNATLVELHKLRVATAN